MSDLTRRGMSLRTGVHAPLEDAANEILRQHLSGITRHSDKADILTPWKEHSRRSREVMVPSGAPDASTRQGNYHRAWNPAHDHLNSVDGVASLPRSRGCGPNVWDSE